MSTPVATAIPGDSAATAVAPPPGSPAAHVSQFFTRLKEQYEQGKFFDVCDRCIVPERHQQESESDSASDLSVPSPASPLQHESQRQEDSGEDGNETEDEDGSLASPPVSPQAQQQQQQNEDAEGKHEACTTELFCHAIVLCARSPLSSHSCSRLPSLLPGGH